MLKSLELRTFFVVSGENEIINCWYRSGYCINFKRRIYVCCWFSFIDSSITDVTKNQPTVGPSKMVDKKANRLSFSEVMIPLL